MTKKVISLLVSLVALTYTFNSVLAQTPTVKSQRLKPNISITEPQLKTERQEKLLEIREKVAEKKASLSAKLSDRKKENVGSYWDRLYRRLSVAIDRLDVLAQRIESRLNKINENNPEVDTTGVSEQLDEAKVGLSEAKTKLVALEEVVAEALDSDDPKAAFDVVQESVKDIKVILISVHTTLVHVIGDVRGLRVGAEDLNEFEKPSITNGVTSTLTPTKIPTITLTPSPEPLPSI